jgi:hypothetical protein
MHAPNVIPLYSDGFKKINQWFQTSQPPYNVQDILRFNSLYRLAYPVLSNEEKRRIEEFVDLIIKGVGERKLIPKIFGVV